MISCSVLTKLNLSANVHIQSWIGTQFVTGSELDPYKNPSVNTAVNPLIMGRRKKKGPVRDLNPGPLAPKARIIPLDQLARTLGVLLNTGFKHLEHR